MVLGSFATFAMLYCVQPLMPLFTRAFSISPAAASLSLSAATGVLAVAMIFAGTLSDAFGRKAMMTASLAAAAAATLAASFAPNWTAFVALRALTGLALSGVPAVAMAYLVEEMDRSAIGLAMGLYIAGNTFGRHGRPLGERRHSPKPAVGARPSFLSGSFRSAAQSPSLSRCQRSSISRQKRARRRSCRRFAPHFSDPGLRYLFALGFLLMGVFVTTYNYIGFRLEAPPFSLSPTTIGWSIASISSARSPRPRWANLPAAMAGAESLASPSPSCRSACS